MGATTYALFPDSREYETEVVLANEKIRARNAVTGAEYHTPFRPAPFTAPVRSWISYSVDEGMEPSEMLALLRSVDWVYPALVVWRTEGADTRWNQALLGLNKPEFGEVDA
jgi:hypothetical protein